MTGSLRTRLTLGALVWMVAVLFVVIALLAKVTRDHPVHREPFTYYVAMGIVAGAFVVVGFLVVRRAIAPFRHLRASLSSVREGRSHKMEGDYPTEVQPLVDDLNALLEDRERAVARALATAGDLAHGLKTPLAVLAQEAEQAGTAGHHDLATSIRQLVDRMQRQIDYHLARSRASATSRAAPAVRCLILPSVEGLVRTMGRLHAGREVTIDSDVSPADEFRGRREDLEEMLGNLLDNACKWAHSRVVISSSIGEAVVVVTVDDDGPGLDPAIRAQVLQRGVRADQQVAGSGLGLPIVRDLAELYGGSVTLEASPLGGMRATLQLPRP